MTTEREAERAAIVKWLREQAIGFDELNLVWMGDFLRRYARQIQEGDHIKEISPKPAQSLALTGVAQQMEISQQEQSNAE